MGELWIWVGLLFVVLLGVHWRYAWRGRKEAEHQWQQVQQCLSRRHTFLSETIQGAATPDLPVEAARNSSAQRCLSCLKRVSRLSATRWSAVRAAAESRKLIEQLDPDEERRMQLIRLDRGIQNALAYYDIAARSYNRRLEGFPGTVVAVLGGFTPAPELKIESVVVESADD
jgi:hypothetical protein